MNGFERTVLAVFVGGCVAAAIYITSGRTVEDLLRQWVPSPSARRRHNARQRLEAEERDSTQSDIHLSKEQTLGGPLEAAIGKLGDTWAQVKKNRLERERIVRALPLGLHNSGNTCYINGVLQIMAAAEQLQPWIFPEDSVCRDITRKPVDTGGDDGDKICNGLPIGSHEQFSSRKTNTTVSKLLETICDTLHADLSTVQSKRIARRRLERALDQFLAALAGENRVLDHGQQDALEFLQYTLAAVMQDRNSVRSGNGTAYESVVTETSERDSNQSLPSTSPSTQNGLGSLLLTTRDTDGNCRYTSKVLIRSGPSATIKICGTDGKQFIDRPPFVGVIAHTLRCAGGNQVQAESTGTLCRHASQRLETTTTLSVLLPNPRAVEIALEACLEHWCAAEFIEDATCEGCGRPGGLFKDVRYQSLPELLWIHIARVYYSMDPGADLDMMHGFKSGTFVRYGEYLDMAPYLTQLCLNANIPEPASPFGDLQQNQRRRQGVPPHPYRLIGVLVHTGSSGNGHFVSYVRCEVDSDNNLDGNDNQGERTHNYGRNSHHAWAVCNDDRVRESSLQEALSQQAYLLLYARDTDL